LAYLNAALVDGDPAVLLLALRDVVEARLGSVGRLAEKSGLHRVSLYRTLSKKGNPEFATIETILNAIGFRLAVETKKE
jgi:probable addiction module antidote protein